MHERVVLGMTVTVDEELVWDDAVVAGLVDELSLLPEDLTARDQVDDLRSMVAALLTHLADGSGAEHYVSAPGPLLELASRFRSTRTLGGTGVRAGIALAAIGVASTAVMVAADPDVHRLLPLQCRPVATSEVTSLVPHVIVQYVSGTRVQVGNRTVVAPAPNRVIFAHDAPNEELTITQEYPQLVGAADVVLVSSLNAVRDEELLSQRIDEIGAALTGAPPGCTLIWEDAGYHIPAMALGVTRAMAACVHVVSMNEDELQRYAGRPVDLLDADAVGAAVREVRELVGARTLVVHTRWWALAIGEDAERMRLALRSGISMASARYAYGDFVGLREYDEAGTWPSDPRSREIAALLSRDGIPCEPGVVPPAPHPTTIGLGDAFAGGLVGALVRERAGARPCV